MRSTTTERIIDIFQKKEEFRKNSNAKLNYSYEKVKKLEIIFLRPRHERYSLVSSSN